MRRRRMHYILGKDARTPRPASLAEWAMGYEAALQRGAGPPRAGDGWARVADTMAGGVRVSTVFLGLDHQWLDGPALLFETMVFGGPHDESMERYSTWAEAEAGHLAWLAKVEVSH